MNEQRIRITLACTDEIRRIIENIGDGYGWPDAVSSTLRDAAEHCATGTFRLEQGVPAQELLWFPATDGMDGVSIGTLECLGDEATPAHDEKWHDDRCGACQKVWGECVCDTDEGDDENPTAPEEGDYVLHPAGPLGGCTLVSVDGLHKETFSPLGYVSADDLALEWVRADMAANDFRPNIWRMDDHGGYTLLTL